jgi:hypothetical protein
MSLLCGKALALYLTQRTCIEHEQNELRAQSDGLALAGILTAEEILAMS